MPLATPTALTVTRLRAVGEDSYAVSGSYFPGPKEIRIYGLVKWTNSESADHTVEVVTGCSSMCHISTWNETVVLEKGSDSADVLLAKFYASVAQGYQTANISVQLRGASGDSSVVSTTTTANLSVVGTYSSNFALSFGTALILPSWSTVLWKPTLSINENDTGAQVASFNLSSLLSEKIQLPNNLVAGKLYKATIDGRPDFERKVGYIPEGAFPYYQILPSSLGTQSFVFSVGATVNPFSVASKSVRAVKNQNIRIPIEHTHPATFTILSGAPSGFVLENPDDSVARPAVVNNSAALVGTPIALGVSTIAVRGTRISDGTQSTGTITLTVVDSGVTGNKIQITVNPGWLNNGLSYVQGDTISVALSATPSNVTWRATGLPPGLSIVSSSGLITGKATTAGRYLASIVAAPADLSMGLLESDPAIITFTIRSKEGSVDADPPSGRIPWLWSEWNLADLQVFARTREVQSTLFKKESKFTIKVGDNINFAVFFIGGDDRPFALDPTRLRITIRPGDNLEGSLVFDSDTAPAAVTTEPDPYYLLAASTAGRERQIVQEWVEDTGKNEPLPCVADVDWVKDGQHFSSASFPVLLELDVTRP
jgi:hypothetical protein